MTDKIVCIRDCEECPEVNFDVITGCVHCNLTDEVVGSRFVEYEEVYTSYHKTWEDEDE